MGLFDFLRKRSSPTKPIDDFEVDAVGKAMQKGAVKFTTQGLDKTTVAGKYLVDGIVAGVVSKVTKPDGKVYEIWQGRSREAAMAFLRRIPKSEIPNLYYVIVENPEGAVGKDLNGIFDEDSGADLE